MADYQTFRVYGFIRAPQSSATLAFGMDGGVLTSAAVKAFADLLKDRISRWLDDHREDVPDDVPKALAHHLAGVNNWSAKIQFYGMTSARGTKDSIPLHFGTPRQFKGLRPSLATYVERDLLRDSDPTVLLGAPGSGKTTTLKRLSRRLLDRPVSSGEITLQCPLVVRLKDLKQPYSIYRELISILGLTAAVRRTGTDSEEEDDGEKEAEISEWTIGGLPYRMAVHEILDKASVLLLIDGLDEIDNDSQVAVRSELQSLGRSLTACKLIVTDRSGDYQTHLDGFNIYEICPLTAEEIGRVAKQWMKKSAPFFLDSLKKVPYSDMADRPLLLAQLLKLFTDDGVLPQQPAEVYERMLKLLLQEWDKERGLKRTSKYSGFTVDRKGKFLAALSYHLTVNVRTKVFTEKMLIDAYDVIGKAFALPPDEARAVAKELESHNGIIVQGSRTEYEFSHLSFQEYLCAEYLVRDSFPDRFRAYFKHNPAPVAVAVAISSNPTNWLAGLLLRQSVMLTFTVPSLRGFLQRMLVERPVFQRGPVLGLVAQKLYWIFGDDDQSDSLLLDAFIGIDEVYASLADSLVELYSAYCFQGRRVLFRRISQFANDYGFQTQENVSLPRSLVERLLDDTQIALRCKPELEPGWISSSSKELSALPDSEDLSTSYGVATGA